MTTRKTKPTTPTARDAFAAGARRGGPAPAVPTRAERDAEALAKAQRDAARAKEDAARATLASNALVAAVDGGVTDPLVRRRVQNTVIAEWEKARREQRAFDYADTVKRALHAVAPGAVAPVPSREPVHPDGRTMPRTFQDVQAEREAYRKRLRELGLLDPATQSTPGNGGPYG